MEALQYIQSLPTVSEDKLEDMHLTTGDHVEHPNTTWGVAQLNGEMVFVFEDGDTYHYLEVTTLKKGMRDGLIAYIINDKVWVYAETASNILTGETIYFTEFGIDMTMPFLQQLSFKALMKR